MHGERVGITSVHARGRAFMVRGHACVVRGWRSHPCTCERVGVMSVHAGGRACMVRGWWSHLRV